MMTCLERQSGTGPGPLESAFEELSARLKKDDTEMLLSIWWSHRDPIVARESQRQYISLPRSTEIGTVYPKFSR